MSASRIVQTVVRDVVPPDYKVFLGETVAQENATDQYVSVYPVAGSRDEYGFQELPIFAKPRIRVRLRGHADTAGDWLDAMGDAVLLAVQRTPRSVSALRHKYFHPQSWLEGVKHTWDDIIVRTVLNPRLSGGRNFSNLDIEFEVMMRPDVVRPVDVPWDWSGTPFTVYETASTAAPAAVQRVAVDPGRVMIGGLIQAGAVQGAVNPPDDAFPDGARQGEFPNAQAGEPLWRNTSVGTGSSGGVVNLFDTSSTNDIPRAAGGGTVILRMIRLNNDDSVTFILHGNTRRFEAALEQNGIFIGHVPGGATYTFPLAGAPVTRAGDYNYDVTPPADEGFRTAAAAATTQWDWAFVDGRTWETEEWTSTPPANPRWQIDWRVTDDAGTELFHDTFRLEQFKERGGVLELPLKPQVVTPTDGAVRQTVALRDTVTGAAAIGPRNRYALPLTVTGLVVHGEDAPAAVQPEPEEPVQGSRKTSHHFSEHFG